MNKYYRKRCKSRINFINLQQLIHFSADSPAGVRNHQSEKGIFCTSETKSISKSRRNL